MKDRKSGYHSLWGFILKCEDMTTQSSQQTESFFNLSNKRGEFSISRSFSNFHVEIFLLENKVWNNDKRIFGGIAQSFSD
jgi:hypothetical protein